MLFEYFSIFFGLFLSLILSFIILNISYILITARKKKDIAQLSIYECGFQPFITDRYLINIHSYLIGMLFVIFDLEIVFLFPFCVISQFLDFKGFLTIIFFLSILTLDFYMNFRKVL